MTISIETSKLNQIKVYCGGGGKLSRNGCPKNLNGYPTQQVDIDTYRKALVDATEHEHRNGTHIITVFVPSWLASLEMEDHPDAS